MSNSSAYETISNLIHQSNQLTLQLQQLTIIEGIQTAQSNGSITVSLKHYESSKDEIADYISSSIESYLVRLDNQSEWTIDSQQWALQLQVTEAVDEQQVDGQQVNGQQVDGFQEHHMSKDRHTHSGNLIYEHYLPRDLSSFGGNYSIIIVFCSDSNLINASNIPTTDNTIIVHKNHSMLHPLVINCWLKHTLLPDTQILLGQQCIDVIDRMVPCGWMPYMTFALDHSYHENCSLDDSGLYELNGLYWNGCSFELECTESRRDDDDLLVRMMTQGPKHYSDDALSRMLLRTNRFIACLQAPSDKASESTTCDRRTANGINGSVSTACKTRNPLDRRTLSNGTAGGEKTVDVLHYDTNDERCYPLINHTADTASLYLNVKYMHSQNMLQCTIAWNTLHFKQSIINTETIIHIIRQALYNRLQQAVHHKR